MSARKPAVSHGVDRIYIYIYIYIRYIAKSIVRISVGSSTTNKLTNQQQDLKRRDDNVSYHENVRYDKWYDN